MMKKADIYIDDSFCGILTEDSEGYHFSYDGNYLKSAGRKVERSFLPDETKDLYRALIENRLSRLR